MVRAMIFIFATFLAGAQANALNGDEAMGSAVLEPWAKGAIDNWPVASKSYSLNTVDVNGQSFKEIKSIKPIIAGYTPLIRTSTSGENYEINFGYSGGGDHVRMERLSRKGDTAVYTQCAAFGCLTVTPDLCRGMDKLSNEDEKSLRNCGNLLATMEHDSAKLKLLTASEVSAFNAAMPAGSHINSQNPSSSADIADRGWSSSIRRAGMLINNCRKLEKTKFSGLKSPVETGGGSPARDSSGSP